MKSIFFTFFTCCLIFLFQIDMQAQGKSTLVKSVPAESPSVVIDIPGEIKTSSWDSDYIRITLTIELTNNTEDILKKLVSVGRYDFKSTIENGTQTITIPKLAQKVTIKGVDLIEKMNIEVMLPYGTKTN